MRTAAFNKIFSVDEYVQHELTADVRSEFINGQLFAMPGEKDINNEIAGNLYVLFRTIVKEKGYQVYAHDVKVKIFQEDKYYYPDIFITLEDRSEANAYIKHQPELIVEVVSESSQVNDYVDKYINYTKIPSLQYYIIVEPQTTLITCYKRVADAEWQTVKYTGMHESVELEKLQFSFKVEEVYA